MKRLLLIPLMIVLVGALILGGCGAPAEVEDKVTALEANEANLLVTINAPLEWGGRNRAGNYYTALLFIKGAYESGHFSSITMYFGPESADLTAAGALAELAAPMFPDLENLDEVCRYYKNQLGVNFVVPWGPIKQHEITVADYITTVEDAEFAAIVANAGRTVGY